MIKKRKRRISNLGLLVGGAVIPSVIGSAMPGTSGAPLQAVGSTFAGFVGPAVAITGAGMVVKQMRRFPRGRIIKRKRLKGGGR